MNDLLSHARLIQKRVFMGTNQHAIITLEIFQRAAKSYQKRLVDAIKKQNTIHMEFQI
jgi:hypothetical protein